MISAKNCTIYVKISQIEGPLFRTPSLWLWFLEKTSRYFWAASTLLPKAFLSIKRLVNYAKSSFNTIQHRYYQYFKFYDIFGWVDSDIHLWHVLLKSECQDYSKWCGTGVRRFGWFTHILFSFSHWPSWCGLFFIKMIVCRITLAWSFYRPDLGKNL